MEFPLQLKFKLIALAPQITVTDNTGQTVCYVKQKLFKFKEAVQIFTDSTQKTKLFEINADRVIDWSARYTFTFASGNVLGSIKRSGMKSLWRAHYTVFGQTGDPIFEVQQDNPWIAVLDHFVGEIPVIGMFTGYMLNPVYGVKRHGDSQNTARLIKKKTFLESGFTITADDPNLRENEQFLIILSALMVTLLERSRG